MSSKILFFGNSKIFSWISSNFWKLPPKILNSYIDSSGGLLHEKYSPVLRMQTIVGPDQSVWVRCSINKHAKVHSSTMWISKNLSGFLIHSFISHLRSRSRMPGMRKSKLQLKIYLKKNLKSSKRYSHFLTGWMISNYLDDHMKV